MSNSSARSCAASDVTVELPDGSEVFIPAHPTAEERTTIARRLLLALGVSEETVRDERPSP
jgi:hypothetical protein